MASKFMKIIKRTIPTLTLIVMASQLFGCGAANSEQITTMIENNTEITIEYADQISTYTDKDNKDCVTSTLWLPLNQITDNASFREAFEISVGGKDLVYTNTSSDVTMQEILRNTTFIANLNNLTSSNSIGTVYIDIDETTSQEVIKAASLNTYFNLFNDKTSGEFNSTQRISRQDFLQAFEKATHSPLLEEQTLSEKEIASLISGSSYLGNNTTNNTEQGKITKVEAAYLIYNNLFNTGSKAEVENTESRAKTLQDSLDDGNITDNNLQASLDTLEAKGIVDSTFTSNWNKTITKTEAINLIVKALEVYNIEQDDTFEVQVEAPIEENEIESVETEQTKNENNAIEVEENNGNYYSEPSQTYEEPNNNYSEPSNNYTEPAPTYDEPSYTPPASSGKIDSLLNGDDDNSSYGGDPSHFKNDGKFNFG